MGHSTRRAQDAARFYRPLLLMAALVASGLVAEIGAGYWWYRTQSSGSALWTLLRSARHGVDSEPGGSLEMVTQYSPASPFRPDDILGFRLSPGRYTVRIQEVGTTRHHTFAMTLDADGCRKVSQSPPRAGLPQVWVMGDSWIFGWGNDDASTLPWFLQRYLPDHEVRCFAAPGYGNLHALLQLRQLLNTASTPHTVVVAYADYFNERNAATAERLATFRSHAGDFAQHATSGPTFTHPRARRQGSKLVVDHVPIFGSEPTAGDSIDAPDLAEQHAITRTILDEIQSLLRPRGIRCVLAWLKGPDGDPVVREAARHGFLLADLRPNARRGEWDDFRPFDPHPGPRAQAAFAAKLREVLDRQPSAENAPATDEESASAFATIDEPFGLRVPTAAQDRHPTHARSPARHASVQPMLPPAPRSRSRAGAGSRSRSRPAAAGGGSAEDPTQAAREEPDPGSSKIRCNGKAVRQGCCPRGSQKPQRHLPASVHRCRRHRSRVGPGPRGRSR